MTRVLAIAGSARRGGNSDTLFERAIEGMRDLGAEIERVVPARLAIVPCRSCGGCWESGLCVVEDQMQELYVKCCEVDHVVVAAPIYFTSVPGRLKVFIDRFQCFWVRTFRLRKPPQPRRSGAFLCAGAVDRQRYYKSCRTIVATWMSVLNIKCTVSRFYPGLDEKDAAAKRGNYLDSALAAGRELLQLSAGKL